LYLAPRRSKVPHLRFIQSFRLLAFHRLGSVGLFLRNATPRQFGHRKLLVFCFQFSRYATSFLSMIVGTCTSSSNKER
jgi:hypothetical protein